MKTRITDMWPLAHAFTQASGALLNTPESFSKTALTKDAAPTSDATSRAVVPFLSAWLMSTDASLTNHLPNSSPDFTMRILK